MDDLISRETMKDLIDITTWYHQNRNKDMVEGASDEETAWFKAKDVFKAIENVPSEQPERKKGEWILTDFPDEQTYRCSSCNEHWTFLEGTPYDNGAYFCPNCGARMEGEWE